MTKIKCKRCRKVVESIGDLNTLFSCDISMDSIDICDGCLFDFRDMFEGWMKGK